MEHAKELRRLADRHMLFGIKNARAVHEFPRRAGLALGICWMMQLDAEEEEALEAAINKAGSIA